MAVGYKLELAGLAAGFANKFGMLDGYRVLRKCLVKPQAAILMYHRVEPRKNLWFFPYSITVSDFENQLKYLLKHYTILSLEELVENIYERKPISKKAVTLTFDDGYKDNYLYAYPILKKYGVPATIFLTTGPIDSGELFWWDKILYVVQHTTRDVLEIDEIGSFPLRSSGERIRAASSLLKRLAGFPEPEKNLLIERIVRMSAVNIPAGLGKDVNLSWADVREMNRSGINIGAHSVTHPILTKLSPEQVEGEVIQSKKAIEERLDREVTAFSYPGGRFSKGTTDFLKESGFRCALTSIARMTNLESNPYELGRIVGGWTYAVFKAMLFGLYPDLSALSHRNNGVS
jgi:peptidoglycan/xylan/chitin deacetylase (PgdA/CDA1 family)